jgi:predicted ATP-dependent endonuclease of OLD family
MKISLKKAHVRNYKSIDDSGAVEIDPQTTVLVGQNESGKTAFLEALNKCCSVDNAKFSYIDDYPRKSLTDYEEEHEKNPALVVVLTYHAGEDVVQEINDALFDGESIIQPFDFTLDHLYNNKRRIGMNFGDKAYLDHLRKKYPSIPDLTTVLNDSKSIRDVIASLSAMDLSNNQPCAQRLEALNSLFSKTPEHWSSALSYYIWAHHVDDEIPEFFYFDEYRILPGKTNLTALKQRQAQKQLLDGDHCVLGLLTLAKVSVDDLLSPTGYEKSTARLEGISNKITDKLFAFWKQNADLEVLFDVSDDPKDVGEFANGKNLYIRIKNRRHRVTVPFDQRSKGFIWFFSFLVWFDTAQQQIGSDKDLILLLDEPGLNLHALAQADFLRYIDTLSEKHQLIYSTHSPFMIHSDRLHQVRVVEDKKDEGTVISDKLTSSSANTVFPLQAALGYTIAQNLFISKRNLLVEGPADLIYLQFFSSALEELGRTHLPENVTIVPAGGLDKLATFVTLLGANDLKIAVLHDYSAKPDQRLSSLVREKIIKDKQVMNYAQFRAVEGGDLIDTDVEDLISPTLYLTLFNAVFATSLKGNELKVEDLPDGSRIVVRLTKLLESSGIELKKGGGFNHYAVANHLASNPISASEVDLETLKRFELVITAIAKNLA